GRSGVRPQASFFSSLPKRLTIQAMTAAPMLAAMTLAPPSIQPQSPRTRSPSQPPTTPPRRAPQTPPGYSFLVPYSLMIQPTMSPTTMMVIQPPAVIDDDLLRRWIGRGPGDRKHPRAPNRTPKNPRT